MLHLTGGLFKWELKFLGLFLALISFCNFIFARNTSALFVPTLSASVDKANLQVNGNQVINSTNKTTEIPLNLTVNTNNKTGYTASLNSETDETALVNNDSSNGAKINSISSAGLLGDFSNNTWGFKFGNNLSYLPIPALSIPSQIIQTTTKTSGNESSRLTLGLKLSDNLESGNYTNKIILSFVSNPYQMQAIMTEGPDFNAKLKSLETSTNKIERFKKNTIAPSASMNVVNIDDEESDYEIKLWLDPTDKTAYYYAEPEKVYLNVDSSLMFYPGDDGQKIKNILEIDPSNFDTSNVTNMHAMFYGMSNLTNLNLSNFDTSKVTDMAGMFANMPNLVTLNLSSFDTSKVKNMTHMFHEMSKLTTLNLSNFDTSKVTSMTEMFSGASALVSLDLSNFNTSNVTDMTSMFAKTANLKNLNLVSFNTEKVRNMSGMFYGSDSLTSLDLSSFNTKNVTNISYMFFGMDKITTINIVNFNTQNVENISYLFGTETGSVDNLTTIYVNNDFNTDKLLQSENIFMNRYQLRGGAGSFLASPSTADKSWLRIDDPTNGRPGYFTRKP